MNSFKTNLFLAAVIAPLSCQAIEDVTRETKEAGWEVKEAIGSTESIFSNDAGVDSPGSSGGESRGDREAEPAPGIQYGWPWIEVEVPLYELVPKVEALFEELGYVEYIHTKNPDAVELRYMHRDHTDHNIELSIDEIRFEQACSIEISNDRAHRKEARDLLSTILTHLGVEATRSGYSD